MTELPTDARPIPFAPGYFITPCGRVFSLRRGRTRATTRGLVREMKRYLCNGYLRLGLSAGGVQIQVGVHRLLLLTFVGSPDDASMEGRHLDGNPTNNDLSNLCWGTSAENAADRARHGREGMKLHPEKHARGPKFQEAVRRGIAEAGTKCHGEAHPKAKLTADDIPAIRASDESSTVLAARFGVSRAAIYFVRANRSWRSVAQETGT
jgi:hypothetical protein